MAERPDLEYAVSVLEPAIRGATIAGLVVKKPVVLRVAVPGEPADLLVGRRIASIARRAHFVLLSLEGGPAPALDLVFAPMLSGLFALAPVGSRGSRDIALTLVLDLDRGDGSTELRFRDDTQMGKVYVIARGAIEQVPGLASVGVDALDPVTFTRERFRGLARGRRDQVRVFLMDKAAIDALGNAYADEVLFAAGIHPKTLVRALAPADLDRLHDSIVKVLGDARATIAARKPPLDSKLRDFLKVRNRHGEPCPRCGGKIRRAGVRGFDAFFCPSCQPETRRTGIVDWRDLEPPRAATAPD